MSMVIRMVCLSFIIFKTYYLSHILFMSSMSMVIRMVCLSIIFDIHDSTTIVPISMVDDMLDPSIWKVNMILSLNIPAFIAISFFTEVCVILVIMHSILEVERIRFFIVIFSAMSSTCSTNTSSRSRQAHGWDDNGSKNKWKSNHFVSAK